MDLGNLRTDEKLENEGAWVDIDPATQLKIASTAGKNYRKIARKKVKPFQTVIQSSGLSALPEDEQDAIAIETMVEGVLLGWRSQLPDKPEADKTKWPPIILMDGEPIEYSKEAARKLLTDLPRFRTMVSELATSIDTFKTTTRENAAKN